MLSEQDERFLLQLVSRGEATLVLGAGASHGSLNRAGAPMLMSGGLAKEIAREAAQNYTNESLTDVLGAVSEYLTKTQITKIYEREFKGVKPSSSLANLFRYTWKRVYTWNIDGAISNISEKSPQKRRYYNGIEDRVAEYEGKEYLHVVYLHGQIVHPERGLIMSESDYAHALSSGTHRWYSRAAQDYLAHNPIFIGASLNEPILRAELDRAMRDAGDELGRAYLVIPDDLTEIQRSKLKNQGVIHIKATLDEFVAWLISKIPSGLSPSDVLANHDIKIKPEDLERLTLDERQSAWSLKPIRVEAIAAEVAALSASGKGLRARQFLRGTTADWSMAGSDVPVWLEATTDLYAALEASMASHDRLFTVLGQAGSGKSTATLQVLLKYIKEHRDVVMYELRGDVRFVRSTFSLLDKLHEQRVILFAPDLFLLGDTFAEDLQALKAGKITVVTTSRLGEWRERMQRHLGDASVSFIYQKFGRADYEPLIEKLLQYVPAPKFVKMTRQSQIQELNKSNSQLLIALREATESKRFNDIIADEFANLPDQDTKTLFLIVGLGTLARVGVNVETAREVYEKLGCRRSFRAALTALDGIVSVDSSSRLVARHELYVRYVFDELVDFSAIREMVIAMLRGYAKYKVPIIKNVNRKDGHLFRFIINHDFVLRRARISGRPALGLSVYEEFEVDFQLDGHYWLQYGLYLSKLDRNDEALQMLRRSIQAYPDNPFAVHAYADLQLREARRREFYDRVTAEMVEDAVKVLIEQDARNMVDVDHYPIVTLANGHIGVLVKFGKSEEARKVAANYFDRLQQIERRISSTALQKAKERVFRFVTLGEWTEFVVKTPGGRNRPAAGSRSRRPRGAS